MVLDLLIVIGSVNYPISVRIRGCGYPISENSFRCGYRYGTIRIRKYPLIALPYFHTGILVHRWQVVFGSALLHRVHFGSWRGWLHRDDFDIFRHYCTYIMIPPLAMQTALLSVFILVCICTAFGDVDWYLIMSHCMYVFRLWRWWLITSLLFTKLYPTLCYSDVVTCCDSAVISM